MLSDEFRAQSYAVVEDSKELLRSGSCRDTIYEKNFRCLDVRKVSLIKFPNKTTSRAVTVWKCSTWGNCGESLQNFFSRFLLSLCGFPQVTSPEFVFGFIYFQKKLPQRVFFFFLISTRNFPRGFRFGFGLFGFFYFISTSNLPRVGLFLARTTKNPVLT